MLIIGGSGFVGGTLSSYASSDYDLHVTVNKNRIQLDNVSVTKVDLLENRQAIIDLIKNLKPDFVVNIGDLLDFHAINMHTHDPDLYSAGHELKLSRKYVKELESIYPKMIEVESNHSSLVYRRALKYGMSKEFLKDYGDFLGTKKWKWVDDLTIDLPNKQRCFFTHGRSADVLKVSQTMGMSAVQGHYHTKFVISWWANPDNLFFAMNVGCLINQKSLAFAYAKNFKTRFILGCGIIIDGIPRLLPMVLNKKGNWIKKLV